VLGSVGLKGVTLDAGAGNDTVTSTDKGGPRVTILGGEGDDTIRAARAEVDPGPGDNGLWLPFPLAAGEAPFEPAPLPQPDSVPTGAVPVGGAGYVLQKRRGVLFVKGLGEILVTPLDAGSASGRMLTAVYVEIEGVGRIVRGLSAKRLVVEGSFHDDVIRLDGHRPGPDGAAGEALGSGLAVPIRATVRAGEGNDRVVGGAAGDVLVGGPGDDTLDGGAGRDRLRGGRRAV
jgi:Ca2+-binding RTX toxin-like protein